MLDIKFIRDNRDLVEMAAQKKRMSVDIGRLIELDDRRLDLQKSVEGKRARQNEVSREIPSADAERRATLARETRGFFEKSFRLGETDLPTRLRIEAEAVEAKRALMRARIGLAQGISQWRQSLGLLPE